MALFGDILVIGIPAVLVLLIVWPRLRRRRKYDGETSSTTDPRRTGYYDDRSNGFGGD